MDTNILDSYIYDDPYFEELDTFCELADELFNINQQIFCEEVTSNNITTKEKVKQATRNTVNSINDIATSYNRITDSGGTVIGSMFGLLISIVNILTKLLDFVVKYVSMIPRLLSSLLNRISSIPANIRDKIKGNIKLYINVESLQLFYDTIFPMITTFLDRLKVLSEGNTWTTFFNMLGKVNNKEQLKNLIFSKSDIKICQEMKQISSKLVKFNITQTTIDMSDKNNIEVYFSDSENIIIKDIKGTRKDNYYVTLRTLYEELNKYRTSLHDLYKTLTDKFNTKTANDALINIKMDTQHKITDSIKSVSVVASVISTFMKATIKDLNTIKKSYDVINKKYEVSNKDIISDKK